MRQRGGATLRCLLPKAKNAENKPFGEGNKPSFEGIFTLMRRNRRALAAIIGNKFAQEPGFC